MELPDRLIRTPEWFQAPLTRFPDITTVVHHVSLTVAEAEEYAARVEVTAIYGNHLLIANLANELLFQLHARQLVLPLSIIIAPNVFERYGTEKNHAIAMSENGVLFINPHAPFWNDPIPSTIALYELGFWSTPHPLHTLYHEAGHLTQIWRGSQQHFLTAREARIAGAVSVRAKEDSDEFVAEVFAGLFVGVQYDSDIIRMFRRFGGREP